jgi:flagellar biogenesis protein FliO
MDHPRSCGVAALASLLISTCVAWSAAADPPVSGVGDATIDPPSIADATASAVVEEPLDPISIAERLAARIDAAEADRRARGAAPETRDTFTEEEAPIADVTPVLPAPRPSESGDRFIDRFDSSPQDETRGVVDLDAPTADLGWWMIPEVRVGLLLAAFIGIAVLARRWSNIRGPRAGRPSGVLSVLARYPFGRGASLVLLEVGPRMVLVHQQGGRGGEVRTITEFDSIEDITELRSRLGVARREEAGFGRDLERNLGLYDRKGRPQGFGGTDGLPLDDVMETVDLTRRRPRRGNRTN